MKAQRLVTTAALVLIPAMLLALPLPPTAGKWAIHKQDWALGTAIVVAIAAAVAYFMQARRSTLALILLGTALMVVVHVGWNKAFRQYVATHSYKREVFRKHMRNVWAPIYGRYDNALARYDGTSARYDFATFPWAIASAAVAAAWFAWARRRPIEQMWDVRSLAILMAFQLALIIAFAACEPFPTRFGLQISGYMEFEKDVHRFKGVFSTLRHYVERMPTLSWYGKHYPPGNLILVTIEQNLGLIGMTKSIVCLCTVLSVVPLVGLARELEFDPVATTASTLLFAATWGMLIYCTINTTSLLLLPGTICLWMLVRGLKTGSAAAAVVLGLAYACYLMFSFSASILGVLMALATAIGWWNGAFSTRNVIRTGAIAVGVLLAFTLALRLVTHFSLIACFTAAVRGHQAQQGNEGFDDTKRYLLRSTGNLIAYVVSVVPLFALAIGATISTKPRAAKALFVATVATVFIAGFSGLFYVETERIWIFLTPFLALAAGHELARRSETEGRHVIHLTLLLLLLVACTQEWLFMHYR